MTATTKPQVPPGYTRIPNVSIIRSSEKSYLIVSGENQAWCPKSQTETMIEKTLSSCDKTGQEYETATGFFTVEIPTWLAKEKGLRGEDGPPQSVQERRPSGEDIKPQDVVMPLSPKHLAHNGTYTATFNNKSQKTFRIRTQKSGSGFAPGQRIIAVLTGNGDEIDYQGLGFVDAAEGFTDMKIWVKWQGSDAARDAISVLCIADKMAKDDKNEYATTGGVSEVQRVQRSASCVVCNRRLTMPESNVSGICSTCTKHNVT